jgi:steroid 5-alpha reductase family enzyme
MTLVSSVGVQFASALVFMALMMTFVFIVSRRLDNYALVDVAWAGGFAPLALFYALTGSAPWPRRLLAGGMLSLWSLRLAWHLGRRVLSQHPREDGRYQELRAAWRHNLASRFFLFFQAQGLLAALLSWPILWACHDPRAATHVFEWVAAALFVVALVGETLADRQLAAFKADTGRTETVCERGLWRYSRHPNYFFEWLVWCAFALLALPAPWGFLALGAPLAMLYFLLRVTGIPATEEQAVRSKGEAYRRYQRSTSAFVPWPRRARSG